MITDYMRRNILTYKDALEYIIEVYKSTKYKCNLRKTFTPALKDMYEILTERERILDKKIARRKRNKIGEGFDA